MLKLLVYAKINHIESARVIEEMTKYHDIYKFDDRIKPLEHYIQRYHDKLSINEELVKITSEMASKKEVTEFNHTIVDGTIIKAYNSKNMIRKKN